MGETNPARDRALGCPTPTTSSARTTRNSVQSTFPAKEEIISQNRQVKDAESGAAYLEKTLLSLVGHSFTIEHLATVLLHIMQLNGVPLLAVEAIRAVAFLLEREAITRIAEAIATQIKTELSKEVASHVITTISPHVVNFLNANKLLNNCIGSLDALHTSAANNLNGETMTTMADRVTSAVDTVTMGVSTVKDAMDQLTPSLAATQSSINLLLSATAELALNPPASQPPQKSYSNAVCSLGSPLPTLSAPAMAALARAAIRERQILIDPHKGHILHSPKQTTTSIAEKLKAILDEIKNLDEATPALIIKAITRLRNSGLIIELDTVESASWLRQEDNKA